MTISQLQNAVYSAYLDAYAQWKAIDKLYNGEDAVLANENRYTFADDMVVYLINPKSAETEIDKYIKRMLNTHCKNNMQGYFEMILATSLMSHVFNQIGKDNLSDLCADWYHDLFFNEDTIYKYITKDQIRELWHLR